MKGDAAPSESMEIADDADADADVDADADFDQTGDDVSWTVWILALLNTSKSFWIFGVLDLGLIFRKFLFRPLDQGKKKYGTGSSSLKTNQTVI